MDQSNDALRHATATPAASGESGARIEGQVAPSLESEYQRLEATARKFRPADDLAGLRLAFDLAVASHAGQTRKSGGPYMAHPLQVAQTLAGMGMDLVTLQTALLHDVLEDTPITVEDLKKKFGEDVARCVNGVTKLSKIGLASREARQAESLRK
ncbi:MAG TPA: HD domain-containing protein, partial [Bryobacteraceae bacterium]|nr:HD domain-containing protein [Bryobacteraceae bacterium]